MENVKAIDANQFRTSASRPAAASAAARKHPVTNYFHVKITIVDTLQVPQLDYPSCEGNSIEFFFLTFS